MDHIRHTVFETMASIKKVNDPPADALLKEDLGFDSIHLVRLITKLTGNLQISILEFSDQDLAGVKTVQQLVDLFRSKQIHSHQ